ncbi:MAG: hypothetical protein Q8N63_05700 [Nanoarchaeota archaeon]|nr:hypothetical protein [Nanoarchaeota archaeon]
MNWFLDMCIIIFYAEVGGKYYQKTETFVKNKKDKRFFVCFYITKENMPRWIKRQKIILRLLKKKLDNFSFEIEEDSQHKELYPKDVVKLKKFIMKVSSSKNLIEEYQIIRRNQEIMLRRVDFFMKNIIDKEVIPIKEIDFELKSTLFTFLQNHSDAMTLASGIQCHQQEELKILTGDKNDWNKNNLEWTFSSRPDLAKKYSKIPEIKYIQNL